MAPPTPEFQWPGCLWNVGPRKGARFLPAKPARLSASICSPTKRFAVAASARGSHPCILSLFRFSLSYFWTGIVRLMSPLHNRCHLSVRLRAVQNLRRFSGYDCKTEQGTDVGNSFFRQAFDTLSKARQGRVGRTNGDNCLSFIVAKRHVTDHSPVRAKRNGRRVS